MRLAIIMAMLMCQPGAEAAESFAGDSRLRCEYEKLEWKRVFLIGQFAEPTVDRCKDLAWTGEGERLWKEYRSDLDRHDRCGRSLWQRRLVFAGGGAAAAVVATWTGMQITRSGEKRRSTILPLTSLGGGLVAGVIAWLTERPCPAMPVPEWAR